MPATMMVLAPVPSHTMNKGARADLGRLFSTTRYGSRISDSLEECHSKVDMSMLSKSTNRKLNRVSNSVMPMWESRALYCSCSTKQRATRLGLEKKKLSIHLRSALTSHKIRKRTNMMVRQEAISWWCLLCFLTNSSCFVNWVEWFFSFFLLLPLFSLSMPSRFISVSFMCHILP